MSSNNIDPKAIESIPLAILKTIPAAQSPPGINPNFANPVTRVPVIVGVGTAFFALAIICFSIRIYTKLVIVKKWRWDDLTCTLGFMCSIVFYGIVVNGCINGGTGKHQWEMHLDKVLSKAGLYQSYVTTIIVTPALGLIKMSLFIQYYLLFNILRWVRISVWIGATASAVFYIAVTVTALALETPWHGETFIEDILSWHYLKFAQFSIPTGVIGVLVDWCLFILPIPAVLGLHMSTAKKLGVLVIFMTGGLAACASIVSLYYRSQLQADSSDATWKVGYILLWGEIEMFAGVAACSMPTVAQFFSRKNITFTSLKSSLKSLLTSSRSSSQEKLPESNSGSTNRGWVWGMSNKSKTNGSAGREEHRMADIDSNGSERKSSWKSSQVQLTHEVEVPTRS